METRESPIIIHSEVPPLCPDVEAWFERISAFQLTSWILFRRHRLQAILALNEDNKLTLVEADVLQKKLGLPNGIITTGIYSGWAAKPFFADEPERGWMLGRPLNIDTSYGFLHRRDLEIADHKSETENPRWKTKFHEIRSKLKQDKTSLEQLF